MSWALEASIYTGLHRHRCRGLHRRRHRQCVLWIRFGGCLDTTYMNNNRARGRVLTDDAEIVSEALRLTGTKVNSTAVDTLVMSSNILSKYLPKNGTEWKHTVRRRRRQQQWQRMKRDRKRDRKKNQSFFEWKQQS